MRVSEYIRRFYDGVITGNDVTLADMCDAMMLEWNAEFKLLKSGKHTVTQSELHALNDKFNRKGNVIQDVFERKAMAENTECPLKKNWFKRLMQTIWDDVENSSTILKAMKEPIELEFRHRNEKPEDDPANWE